MPTQNRRVATYLPPHLDSPFKGFKSKRDIKGDSEALIAILSEYFQVSQEVAYQSSSNLLQRIEAIEERLSNLKSELLSELTNELKILQAKTGQPESGSSSSKSKPLSKLQKQEPYTAPLFQEDVKSSSFSSLESESREILLMTGQALSARFGVHKDTVAKMRSKFKDNLDSFRDWTRSKDPDGIVWEYSQTGKLYHPILN